MAVGSIHEVSFDPQAALLLGQIPGGILDKIHALTANKNEKIGLWEKVSGTLLCVRKQT